MTPGIRSLGVSRDPEQAVTILHITRAEEDHASLRNILSHANWEVYRVQNCRSARRFLGKHPVAIVVSEATLADGDWKHLLEETRSLPEAPSLIVCSRIADERLWAEVLNLGGYDVLLTPFEPTEVVRVLRSAFRASACSGNAAASRKAPQREDRLTAERPVSLAAGGGW